MAYRESNGHVTDDESHIISIISGFPLTPRSMTFDDLELL